MNIKDLESLAVTLIGLPQYLGSDAKSVRKNAKMQFEQVMEKMVDVIKMNDVNQFSHVDIRSFLGKYHSQINSGDYIEAEKTARGFLRDIRDD